MDEDRLSPELGRLIDEAKAAALLLGADAPNAEGVALLADGRKIHSGGTADSPGLARVGLAGADPERPPVSAAELALRCARTAGDEEILAAAVACPGDAAETVPPSAESHRCLMGIDPELPLVFKQQGRWVVLPVLQVHPSS